MKKLLYLVALSCLSSLAPLYSQQSFTLGIDPLVIAVLNGFEAELGYNFGKNRVAVEFLGAELPSVWNGQIDDFEKVSANIFEVAYSRFLRAEQKGFHFGIAYSFFSDYEVEDARGQQLTKDISKLGIRLGYMWFPFKKANFFVEPLLNLGFLLNDEDLNFANEAIFEQKSFAGSGPVLHLGWKFEL